MNETEKANRKRQPRSYTAVTQALCFKWLSRAHTETALNGYFQPKEWEDLGSNSTLPTVTVGMGLTETVRVKGRGGCKRWVNQDDEPTVSLAEMTYIAYKNYAKKHCRSTPIVEIDENGKAVTPPSEIHILYPDPDLINQANGEPPTQLDRIENMLNELIPEMRKIYKDLK